MVDLKAALTVRSRTALEHLYSPLRRGKRVVQMTPASGLGFGNYLYLWLHSFVQQSRGIDYRVLSQPAMHSWLNELPRLQSQLSMSESELRFTDRRQNWRWEDLNTRFGVDFTQVELQSFVRHMLLETPLFAGVHSEPDVTTINVRRGDYYSKAHLRGTYSFDIAEYLDVALSTAEQERGEHVKIQVISDDLAWCQTKLHRLLESRARSVEYLTKLVTAQDHFRFAATSRRIIGTNSTFSYWAGHLSNVMFGELSQVVMPSFHARLGDSFRASQLDPEWTIIEDIPGGWDG